MHLHICALGNFTQMVWAATREVGFGKASGNGQCVVVAHYRPPGNVRGRYKSNVFPPTDGKANQFSNPGKGPTTSTLFIYLSQILLKS